MSRSLTEDATAAQINQPIRVPQVPDPGRSMPLPMPNISRRPPSANTQEAFGQVVRWRLETGTLESFGVWLDIWGYLK